MKTQFKKSINPLLSRQQSRQQKSWPQAQSAHMAGSSILSQESPGVPRKIINKIADMMNSTPKQDGDYKLPNAPTPSVQVQAQPKGLVQQPIKKRTLVRNLCQRLKRNPSIF